ncbi:hypothetical protein G7070_05680 [Propioniciclava coleopterorum]|uniref:Uncharacterized protein n=1 Tax=Propioniciclava coleopterorum TaxID=2714937 RepID=A0A6G7Y5E0_9ACTN|nr:hypothetical protein [Propioniciclava coleopterorum]QIK71858.1 hypothetical protein G7070_05680 [Propioniciclava coleopterorum]
MRDVDHGDASAAPRPHAAGHRRSPRPRADRSRDAGAGPQDPNAPSAEQSARPVETHEATAPVIPVPVDSLPADGTPITLGGRTAARPAEIDFGKPTTKLTNLLWEAWGNNIAEARGEAQATASSARTTVRVQADQLGTCNGKPAYTRLQWWFPDKPEASQPAPINACTGAELPKS